MAKIERVGCSTLRLAARSGPAKVTFVTIISMGTEVTMKVQLGVIAVVGSALSLSACETTTAIPYQASTQNVITAQRTLKSEGSKVSLGSFNAGARGVAKPTCRAMGQLDIAPGKTIESFIRDAFQTELFMANGYDENADIQISATVDSVDVNTMGTGSWKIAMTVKSNAYPQGYTVNTDYSFATSFSAVNACQNAVSAFNPAVQDLLGRVVSSSKFPTLTGRSK